MSFLFHPYPVLTPGQMEQLFFGFSATIPSLLYCTTRSKYCHFSSDCAYERVREKVASFQRKKRPSPLAFSFLYSLYVSSSSLSFSLFSLSPSFSLSLLCLSLETAKAHWNAQDEQIACLQEDPFSSLSLSLSVLSRSLSLSSLALSLSLCPISLSLFLKAHLQIGERGWRREKKSWLYGLLDLFARASFGLGIT